MEITRINDWSDSDHKFGMHDPAWRQMVYDYRLWLLARSTRVTFTMPDAHQWRFRLEEFIQNKYRIPYDAVWIVFYLNNLTSIEYDGGVLTLEIPESTVLEELYSIYELNANLS
jgi:hypothetical protein